VIFDKYAKNSKTYSPLFPFIFQVLKDIFSFVQKKIFNFFYLTWEFRDFFYYTIKIDILALKIKYDTILKLPI
jgi:hypothetical protein